LNYLLRRSSSSGGSGGASSIVTTCIDVRKRYRNLKKPLNEQKRDRTENNAQNVDKNVSQFVQLLA